MLATNLKALLIAAIILATLGVLATRVLAAKPTDNGECKPGWGFGDKNHCHAGPPGHTVHPVKG